MYQLGQINSFCHLIIQLIVRRPNESRLQNVVAGSEGRGILRYFQFTDTDKRKADFEEVILFPFLYMDGLGPQTMVGTPSCPLLFFPRRGGAGAFSCVPFLLNLMVEE